MVYYQIDDKVYYLNLDTLFTMIAETPNNEKIVNTTITQYYGGEEQENINNGKEITETKSNMNETMNNVKYDFIKYLVSCLLSNGYGSEGSPISIMRFRDLSVGQVLCLNTLIEYKILCEH